MTRESSITPVDPIRQECSILAGCLLDIPERKRLWVLDELTELFVIALQEGRQSNPRLLAAMDKLKSLLNETETPPRTPHAKKNT